MSRAVSNMSNCTHILGVALVGDDLIQGQIVVYHVGSNGLYRDHETDGDQ